MNIKFLGTGGAFDFVRLPISKIVRNYFFSTIIHNV